MSLTEEQAKAACERIMAHTPGPWKVFDSYDQDHRIILWDGDEQSHKPICNMGEIGDMNYAQDLANAKLIAAAPDMLAAITYAIAALAGSDGVEYGELIADADKARKCLQKALKPLI